MEASKSGLALFVILSRALKSCVIFKSLKIVYIKAINRLKKDGYGNCIVRYGYMAIVQMQLLKGTSSTIVCEIKLGRRVTNYKWRLKYSNIARTR